MIGIFYWASNCEAYRSWTYETVDIELRDLNEKVSTLAEKLHRQFGQRYANMLMKASWDILKTKNEIEKKRWAKWQSWLRNTIGIWLETILMLQWASYWQLEPYMQLVTARSIQEMVTLPDLEDSLASLRIGGALATVMPPALAQFYYWFIILGTAGVIYRMFIGD